MILIPCLWIALGLILLVQDMTKPYRKAENASEPILKSCEELIQKWEWECPV